MIAALEADGFKVERPEPTKGRVMEPKDEGKYWFAFPFGNVLNLTYDEGSEGDILYCEAGRIFYTEKEARERNEQGAKGEWRMIYVPTLADQARAFLESDHCTPEFTDAVVSFIRHGLFNLSPSQS